MSVMASFSSTSPPALRTSDPFIGPSHNLPLKALFSPMQRHGWIRLSAHCHIGMPISSKVFKGAIHHCHPRIALSSHGKDKHCCRAPPVFQVRRVTSLDNLLPVICQAWVRGGGGRGGMRGWVPFLPYRPTNQANFRGGMDGRGGGWRTSDLAVVQLRNTCKPRGPQPIDAAIGFPRKSGTAHLLAPGHRMASPAAQASFVFSPPSSPFLRPRTTTTAAVPAFRYLHSNHGFIDYQT